MPSGNRLCLECRSVRPVLKRPKTGDALCKECFFTSFEKEVHETIIRGHIFRPGMRVAIGASGGKDSTVLVHTLKTLNERYSYGLDLFLLSIDEGITGYREDSLETVKTNQSDYGLPLKILSYKDLYGWTMDEIVQMAGRKNNCTFCGVFRRQALERGAALLGCDMIATGHNADDVAETVLMNLLRGDIARLHRSISVVTETKGSENLIPRCKPFKYTYEKEIVLYAYFKKLLYFSTECTYAPFSYRGFARTFLKDLESIRPRAIIDIIHSAEQLVTEDTVNLPTQRACLRCQFISSQEVCKACIILEGLKRGMPKLGVGKSSKAKRLLGSSAKSEEKKTAPPSAPTSADDEENEDEDGEVLSSSLLSTPCSTCTCSSGKNE